MMRYEARSGVATLTLDRPEKRNALSRPLVLALDAALRRAEADDEVQVVLLRGEGSCFCAGGDIEGFSKLKDTPAPRLYEDGKADADLFALGQRLRKPRVAEVHGPVRGGGVGLVALCHVAIAARSATFGLTEINLGLFPFNIAPLLVDALGSRRALELALSGRIFAADEAFELGLVQRIVGDEDLEAESRWYAETIAARSPLALRLGVEAFTVAGASRGIERFDAMNALRTMVLASEDMQEGALAFLEKREPRWIGR